MNIIYRSNEQGFNQDRRIVDAPSEYTRQSREGQCDAQGNFRISDLPAGDYYVITGVHWVIGSVPQGGNLMRRVSLAAGQNAEVFLTIP